jgi:hypothetical protein
MCRVLFIAASAPLAELPYLTPPAPFSIALIDAEDAAVRTQFTLPYVYRTGAHTGCGCGFSFGHAPEDTAAGRESVRQLREALTQALEHVDHIELYSCWEGDTEAAPDERAEITPAWLDLDAAKFVFEERWFATVRPSE